jgi:hypothetical protein
MRTSNPSAICCVTAMRPSGMAVIWPLNATLPPVPNAGSMSPGPAMALPAPTISPTAWMTMDLSMLMNLARTFRRETTMRCRCRAAVRSAA